MVGKSAACARLITLSNNGYRGTAIPAPVRPDLLGRQVDPRRPAAQHRGLLPIPQVFQQPREARPVAGDGATKRRVAR